MVTPSFLKPPGEPVSGNRLVTHSADPLILSREEMLARFGVSTTRLIESVARYAYILGQGVEPVKMHDGEITMIPLGRDRISSLKAAADLSVRLLNKVLPDLKQVEMVPADKDEAVFNFSITLAE